MTEEAKKVVKDVMDDIKDEIPKPIYSIIVILGIACGLMVWAFKQVLDSYDSLEHSVAVLWLWILIIAFLAALSGIIVLLIVFVLNPYRKMKKTMAEEGDVRTHSNSEQKDGSEPKGKVTAYIVEQNNPDRDKKFIAINQGVKKTYSVLGAALTSIAENEYILKRMARTGVKIRLCTMNPDIAVDDICKQEIKNRTCFLIETWLQHDPQNNMMQVDIQKLFDDVSTGDIIDQNDHLLKLMHILIDSEHMKAITISSGGLLIIRRSMSTRSLKR